MDLMQDFSPALLGTPGHGDLAMVNGDLTLVDGVEAIQQAAVQNMRTLQGECFLNLLLGVPYFQSAFGRAGDFSAFESALQDAILATPGVLSITYWNLIHYRAERRLDITFRATTTAGAVSWSGAIGP